MSGRTLTGGRAPPAPSSAPRSGADRRARRRPPTRRRGWTLLVDGTAQGAPRGPGQPVAHPKYESVPPDVVGTLIDLLHRGPASPLRALHLGGGRLDAGPLLAATRAGSAQRVVELDGALAELVEPRPPADGLGIEVTVGDARAALQGSSPRSLDLLVLDVFAGSRIPSHLTSVEFLRSAAAVLDRDGVPTPRTWPTAARARLRGPGRGGPGPASDVLLAPPDVLHGRRFGNLVLVGAAPRCRSPACAAGARPVPGAGAGRGRADRFTARPDRPYRRPLAAAAAGILGTPRLERRSPAPWPRWPGARRTCPRSTSCRPSHRSTKTSRCRRRGPTQRRWRPIPPERSAWSAARC